MCVHWWTEPTKNAQVPAFKTLVLLTKKISDDKNFADTKNLGFDRLSVNFCEIQQDLEKKMCLKFLGAGPLVGNCRRGQ